MFIHQLPSSHASGARGNSGSRATTMATEPPSRESSRGPKIGRKPKPLPDGLAARWLCPALDLSREWDDLSMETLFARFPCVRRRHGGAQSTYDALLHALRTYGLAALERPNCLRRLADLSTAQVRELIAALIRLRPQHATTITDI
jgi:hypothetical protein